MVQKLFGLLIFKTFFDIVICYIKTKSEHCKCYDTKCNWCRRISPLVYSACYFSNKNHYKQEVVSKVMIEFDNKSLNEENSSFCAKQKRVCADVYELVTINDESEREQYTSDYGFD